MKQIKEKPERIKGLKEYVRTAPKEVLRRSVNVGAERMKEQLRESRQQEQPEDYASEKIAAVAEGIPSAAVSAAARLRVKKAAEKKRTTVQEEARGAEGRNIAIKTKESCIQYQAPTAADIQQTAPTSSEPPQTLIEGRQVFIKARNKQAIRQTAKHNGAACLHSGNEEIFLPADRGQTQEINGQPLVSRLEKHEINVPSRRAVREDMCRYDLAAKQPKTEVKTIQRMEVQAGRVVGRTPKQAIKTADVVETPPKSAQAVRQAKNLAVRSVRSAQKVTKEAAVAAGRIVSSALSGLLAAGGGIVVMIILVVVLFGGVLLLFGEGPDSTAYTPVSEEVQAYEPLIRLYAEQHGIPEYVELIMAVMMTESGGKGSDPMQSSESGFNTRYPRKPNGITDPEYSINVGIQTLAASIKAAGVESPADLEHIKLCLQGYNFGNGYISWALDKYGGYSETNAIEFSEMMAKRLGWKRYGSTKYVSVVLQYYPYGHAPSDAGSGDFIWPLPGYTRISSPFGYRTCPYHGRELHGGVDLPAPHGTNILAAQSGTVVVSTYGSSYGNYIAISHPDGSRTMYCHMSARLVSVGDTVSQGQIIGRVGSTGNSTGNHLHFEVWTNSNSSSRVNPMDYF